MEKCHWQHCVNRAGKTACRQCQCHQHSQDMAKVVTDVTRRIWDTRAACSSSLSAIMHGLHRLSWSVAFGKHWRFWLLSVITVHSFRHCWLYSHCQCQRKQCHSLVCRGVILQNNLNVIDTRCWQGTLVLKFRISRVCSLGSAHMRAILWKYRLTSPWIAASLVRGVSAAAQSQRNCLGSAHVTNSWIQCHQD